jgi:2-methylisocitrate lyase-like PEP mutase family enzyme
MHLGQSLRAELESGGETDPFLGFFDCFSATIGARFSSNLFLSGFGFAASYYGLPDNGFISWSDVVQAAWRVRQILPTHRLLVDIDDGYADTQVACRVVRELEAMGVAMVMLEDQGRPRRCGHADGKILVGLDAYLAKLNAVLDQRHAICVLARTDASGEEIYRRVEAIQQTKADAILVDGVSSVDTLRRIRSLTDKPLAFNQIAGGKSPRLSINALRAEGSQIHIYSTPMLFAAQSAMVSSLQDIFADGGRLPDFHAAGQPGVKECTSLLQQNLPVPALTLANTLKASEAELDLEYLQMACR